MQENLVQFFEVLGLWAIVASIIINIVVSILGVVPSIFITAANILVFGLPLGIGISIAGEALGAIISFYLYRLGIHQLRKIQTNQKAIIRKLEHTEGWQAFWGIFSLRILPFIPSGLVTFISATSKVHISTFALASTLGKIPALFIEAFSIYGVIQANLEIKIILACVGLGIFITLFFKSK